jgi:threonylcarbamoyladenosine tRNA methylthiotransferase MtaB
MNVYLDMVGCKLNQAEIEIYARQLRAAGYDIVASADKADLVVVNTCSVTGAAASDSRQKIRQASRSDARVIVTGCWSTLDQETATSMPGVDKVIPNPEKDDLVELIFGPGRKGVQPNGRVPLSGSRKRTRAFIKVQDGCDNHCTYCVTRLARGHSRSIPIDQVVSDINYAVAGGAREAVLTGVQIGSWGRELSPALRLSDLVDAILLHTDVPRLRISSIEPWEVDDRLIRVWQDSRLCRHFHLPLQSGSPSILKRMARKTGPVDYQQLVEKIRSAIPGVSITTDIIVGFPGEDETAFEETRAFIETQGFSGGHVFIYSARPGTPAAGYPDQVPFAIRRQRSRTLRALLSGQSESFHAPFIGQVLDVLWERSTRKTGGWLSSGLSDNYIKVTAETPGDRWNVINRVMIRQAKKGGLVGEVVEHENEIIAAA